MTTDVVAQFGGLSATGAAREPGFGQTTAPTTTWPMTGNNLNLDPGLFSPKVMQGRRDLNSYALYGQYKNAGTVAGPVFPTNGSLFIPGAIGADAAPGFGVTGTGATSATTTSSPITAASSALALTSATGYAVGSIVQVDTNNTVTPTTSEVRKIATLTGTNATVDKPWTYAHASGVAVSVVTAPFTHTITQQNSLPSYTVEKNLGDFESLQFSGARVNKLSLSAQTTDSEATMSVDLVAKSVGVLDSPSPIAVVAESPFVFAEGTLSLFSQTLAQAENFSIDIDNALISSYTFNQSHNLQFLTPGPLHVSGKADVIWDSFDDATWGYFNQMLAEDHGTLSFLLQHPGSPTAGSVEVTCTNVYLKGVPEDPKMEDVVKSTLNFEAFLDYGVGATVGATILNSYYLPL